MANYVISEKNKTITIDFKNATAAEKEEAQYLAQANGYKLNIKKERRAANSGYTAAATGLKDDFIISYLSNTENGVSNYETAKNKPSANNPKRKIGFLGGKKWFIENYPIEIDTKTINNTAARKELETFIKTNTDIKAQRKAYWKYYFK